MRLIQLLLFPLFGLLAAGALHAQSSTTATILRPYITSISPQSLLTGVDSTVLTIKGKRFQRGAEVFFNARKLTKTRLEGDSVLVVVIPGELTTNPDVAVLMVENPDESKVGARISILSLPSPKIDWYLPRFCPSTTNILTIGGMNFSSGAAVRADNALLPIVALNSTIITVVVPDVIVGKFYWSQLTVTNPDGQQALQRLFPLPEGDNPASISKIDPPMIVLGSTKTLVITGINFENALCGLNLKVMLEQITLTTIRVERNLIIVRLPDSIQAGTYQLRVILFDGRTASQTIILNAGITGIQTEKKNTTLYPNPATTALTLETTLDRAATLTLTLRNVMGASVLEERHTAASGRFATTLDVSVLASGVYVLEVSDGVGRWAQKFVKY